MIKIIEPQNPHLALNYEVCLYHTIFLYAHSVRLSLSQIDQLIPSLTD